MLLLSIFELMFFDHLKSIKSVFRFFFKHICIFITRDFVTYLFISITTILKKFCYYCFLIRFIFHIYIIV
nr:MAG TPA: hypothetical protein [Bacteriophage sp.]